MSCAQATKPTRQAARQRLGKAARVNYTVELIKRRKPRRRLYLQIAENVVLDDSEVMPLCGLQDFERHMRAHVGSGRILHHRLGEVHLRLVRRRQFLENCNVRAVEIARYRQHFTPCRRKFPNML